MEIKIWSRLKNISLNVYIRFYKFGTLKSILWGHAIIQISKFDCMSVWFLFSSCFIEKLGPSFTWILITGLSHKTRLVCGTHKPMQATILRTGSVLKSASVPKSSFKSLHTNTPRNTIKHKITNSGVSRRLNVAQSVLIETQRTSSKCHRALDTPEPSLKPPFLLLPPSACYWFYSCGHPYVADVYPNKSNKGYCQSQMWVWWWCKSQVIHTAGSKAFVAAWQTLHPMEVRENA